MYAITGITGQIGGAIGRLLLAQKQSVRAVMRDARKGQTWADRGCEVAIANIEDASALAAAFQGAKGVFVVVPPNFDPSPGFLEAQAIGASLRSALTAARPPRVVYLSTIGAQASQSNLLSQHSIIEKALGDLPISTAFLRPAWFMENSSWDIVPARTQGVIPSFLQPLDKPVPMVATIDIGKAAVDLLQQAWDGHRVVELEGPRRVTPNEIAATFATLLDKPVQMKAVPRESWEELFRAQGMNNPLPRIRMLDGFNEGWIEFENGETGSQKGSTSLESVLQTLIQGETDPRGR